MSRPSVYRILGSILDVGPSCSSVYVEFLGEQAKLRKPTISFVLSVCPFVRLSAWNNSAPTGRFFMKIKFWVFFDNLSKKIKFHYNLTRIKILYMTANTHN